MMIRAFLAVLKISLVWRIMTDKYNRSEQIFFEWDICLFFMTKNKNPLHRFSDAGDLAVYTNILLAPTYVLCE